MTLAGFNLSKPKRLLMSVLLLLSSRPVRQSREYSHANCRLTAQLFACKRYRCSSCNSCSTYRRHCVAKWFCQRVLQMLLPYLIAVIRLNTSLSINTLFAFWSIVNLYVSIRPMGYTAKPRNNGCHGTNKFHLLLTNVIAGFNCSTSISNHYHAHAPGAGYERIHEISSIFQYSMALYSSRRIWERQICAH